MLFVLKGLKNVFSTRPFPLGSGSPATAQQQRVHFCERLLYVRRLPASAADVRDVGLIPGREDPPE